MPLMACPRRPSEVETPPPLILQVAVTSSTQNSVTLNARIFVAEKDVAKQDCKKQKQDEPRRKWQYKKET